ncbi:MAG: acyltransferase [Gammaproteobacteria bacterium]|nr:acyltransferase [Gammaproteobacteria bacterium]
MLSFLPSFLKGPLAAALVITNTIVVFIPLFVIALLKFFIPVKAWRRACLLALIWLAEHWISINKSITWLTQDIRWDVEIPDDLDYRGQYLVVSNHQSWADIVVLQHVFNRRIPFLKFFLKKQLIWVPLLGIAWWALDLPFMRRYSREYLEKNPHKRGKDLEITQRACEKFRDMPVSIMNFLEGTRYRPAKHAKQESPYLHLLKPKAGGIAFALNAMDGTIRELVDVTIVYKPHRAGFWDLFSGRVEHIAVRARKTDIPERFLHGDYQNDAQWREEFQAWVRELWERKDDEIHRLLEETGQEDQL